MSPPSPRLAVFDCDGTLVDGQAAIVASVAEAFVDLGLKVPEASHIRRAIGLSLMATMHALAPDADEVRLAALVENYKAAFRRMRAAGNHPEPLFPGIRALLDGLIAEGWVLGIATGKSSAGLAHCLASHGLTSHFTTLQTADQHPSKPHPAMLAAALAEAGARPQSAVMIGDTRFDMAMAGALGVRAIGVSWGYHTPAELAAAGAGTVAANPADLKEILR